MTKLAVKDFFNDDFPIKIDETEIEAGKSIPTFQLIEQYKQKYSCYDFWFVMGTDLISSLHLWN